MAITPVSLINSISSVNSIYNSINSISSFNSISSINSASAFNAVSPRNPIKPLGSVNPISSEGTAVNTNSDELYENNGSLSFSEILRKMIDGTNETNALTKYDSVNLALGLTSDADLHNIEINAVKADLALRTLVSVRNKVLDAYTEIMRMNV